MSSGDPRVFGARLWLGSQGSGKSHGLQAAIAHVLRTTTTWKVLAWDLKGEWPHKQAMSGTPRLRATVVTSPRGALRAFRVGRRFVIVRGRDFGREGTNGAGGLRDDLEELAAAAHGSGAPTILAVCEAWQSLPATSVALARCCPTQPLGYPMTARALHEARHYQVAVWVDSQHFRGLHGELRAAIAWYYFHGTSSGPDLDIIRGMCSSRREANELLEAIRDCGRRARDGEAGWHVRIDNGFHEPPYTPRRG